MADNSVRRNLGRCRQFFEAAVRKRLIDSNPFAHLRSLTVKGNAARIRFVTPAEIQRVIDAAPDAQWRLIIALARFGGVRTPSETLALKWSDVDWERQRIRVPSPKTEHCGKASQEIPLFPELLTHLQDAFELAAEGTEHVVTRYRDATQNLRTTMLKIIKRAGLEPWERVFHNLRASRQTELAQTFPAQVVCDWLGNSEAVAGEHYLHTTEADFQRAIKTTRFPTRAAAEMDEIERNVILAGSPEMQNPRSFRGIRSGSDTCTFSQLPDQGPNLPAVSAGKRSDATVGGTESGTLSGELLISDSRLAKLIEVWPSLGGDVKAEILTLAGLRRNDIDDFNDVTEASPFALPLFDARK